MPYKDKSKNKEYQKEWYKRNRGHHRNSRDTKKIYLQRYKSLLSCTDCGMDFKGQEYLCDFHHLEPSSKKFSLAISNACRYSIKKIKQEIRKCIPLCANCHRTRHHGMGVGTLPTLIQ